MQERRSSSQHETLGIGERLRNAREARGLTLAAAETLTRIRATYLKALEDEQFDRLPASVYARGFLRTYAVALGLDPDELTEAYPAAFDTPEQPPVFSSLPAEIPIHPATPPSRARRIAVMVGAVALLIVSILGYIGLQQMRQFVQPVPPKPSPAAVAEPARPAPPVAQPSQPAPPFAPPSIPEGGIELMVQASGDSWLLVVADGEPAFQGLVHEGDVKVWRARERLTIRVGNTAAVSLRVNGQIVQPDARRRVWEQTFTKEPGN